MAVGVFLLLILVTGMVSFIRHQWFGGKPSGSNHVRVMELNGVILGSQSFLKELQEYVDNKRTKAIVLRINSPGGIVAPSQEMYDAVKRADAKVPVIISMGSVAASGGYYIAMGARKVFANPGTLTGSIGVIMEFINTEKLYDWAKLSRFSITSGKFKDAGSPLRPMTAEEKALFGAMVKDIYGQFRGVVKERRKLTDPELDKVADGRVMTGAQALSAKLVDAVGGIEEAIAEAKKIAGLPENAPVIQPEKQTGLLRKMLLGDDEEPRGWLASFFGAANALPAPVGPSWRVLWLAPLQ